MFVFVIACCALWVFLDASKNKIGKVDGGGFLNISAGAWSVATLLLWIIAFPFYIINRGKLKEKAQDNPVTVSARGFKAFLIAFVGFGWFVLVMYNDYLSRMEQMAQM